MAKVIRLWWHDNGGVNNFGDLLGPYIVKKLTGKQVQYQAASSWPWPKTHMVVGSILAAAKRNCIVWGAGLVQKDSKISKAKFWAVRGPVTRDILIQQGMKVPEVYGDPAILLPRLYDSVRAKSKGVGLIPHIVDFDFVTNNNPDSLKVIDLTMPIEGIIDEINSCELTISSSLHGVIVSHAYGIPSIWVKFSNKLYGDDVKFEDYFKSIDLKLYKPRTIFKNAPTEKECYSMEKELEDFLLPKNDLQKMGDVLLKNCPFY